MANGANENAIETLPIADCTTGKSVRLSRVCDCALLAGSLKCCSVGLGKHPPIGGNDGCGASAFPFWPCMTESVCSVLRSRSRVGLGNGSGTATSSVAPKSQSNVAGSLIC